MTLGNFKYVYSFDGVNYKGNFNARSQARREALAEIVAAGEKDTTFFVGKITNAPCPTIPANFVLQILSEVAEGPEYGGEYSEGWLDDVTPEEAAQLEIMLTATFRAWAKKHGHLPTWQGVTQKDRYRYTNKHVVLLSREVEK